jgi:phosphohistidine phosphatase
MKTIYLVRHAKSSWDDPGISDMDRPLNERGKKDAPRMGKRLKEKGVVPDLMLCSPSKRTLSTCRQFAEILGYDRERIKTEQRLYHADEEEILWVIRNVKDKHDILLVFGHNPGLTDFVNRLSEEDHVIDNLPTCGMVCFTFKVDHWQMIDYGKAQFVFFDFPKNKDD